MQIVSDTKTEREITITMTEAEWREVQQYALYYAVLAEHARAAAHRLESKLKQLNLGERRDWDKAFCG